MNDLDPKKVIDGIRAATELLKITRGLIKEFVPLVKRIPWRTVAKSTSWLLKRVVVVMKEAVTFPEPPRRAILCVKFSVAVASYFLATFCVVLFVANVELIFENHLSPFKSVEASVLLLSIVGITVASFAQADWLRFLLAKDSRVLWGQRPQIKR